MLSEINQQILAMANDGVKYSVIAERLGLTFQVVKSRLHHMRMTPEQKDKLRARRRKTKRDPVKARKYIKDYIKNHPEKPAEWSKAYRERKREAEYKWRRENPDKWAEQRQRDNEKRKARRAEARNTPEAIAERTRKTAEKAERSAELKQLRLERWNEKRRERKLNNISDYQTLKARLDADPEFKAQYLEKRRLINAERRRKKMEAIPPEERERNAQRAREARIKAVREANARRRAEREANPPPKQPKEKPNNTRHLPKVGGKILDKRKPGRLLALMGWRGF
jgi:hypothetical protein